MSNLSATVGILTFQSRKPNNCWLWKKKVGEKKQKLWKLKNSTMDFPQIWSTILRVLNLTLHSIFFKFWYSVSFVKDYSVLVGRHTIIQYFLAKSNLFASSF